MVLEHGDAVLLVHRRLFESDQPRYFIGTVDDYADGVATVTGETWVRDPYSDEAIRKGGERTKVVSVSSGSLIVYLLPAEVDLSTLRIESHAPTNAVWLADTTGFRMDLSESRPSDQAA